MQEQNEDPLEKVKEFFVSGYNKTSMAAKDAIKKVEDKYYKSYIRYKDEEFQAKMTQYKTEISQKSNEIAQKSKVAAEKGYIAVKEGATSAWGFLKTKIN